MTENIYVKGPNGEQNRPQPWTYEKPFAFPDRWYKMPPNHQDWTTEPPQNTHNVETTIRLENAPSCHETIPKPPEIHTSTNRKAQEYRFDNYSLQQPAFERAKSVLKEFCILPADSREGPTHRAEMIGSEAPQTASFALLGRKDGGKIQKIERVFDLHLHPGIWLYNKSRPTNPQLDPQTKDFQAICSRRGSRQSLPRLASHLERGQGPGAVRHVLHLQRLGRRLGRLGGIGKQKEKKTPSKTIVVRFCWENVWFGGGVWILSVLYAFWMKTFSWRMPVVRSKASLEQATSKKNPRPQKRWHVWQWNPQIESDHHKLSGIDIRDPHSGPTTLKQKGLCMRGQIHHSYPLILTIVIFAKSGPLCFLGEPLLGLCFSLEHGCFFTARLSAAVGHLYMKSRWSTQANASPWLLAPKIKQKHTLAYSKANRTSYPKPLENPWKKKKKKPSIFPISSSSLSFSRLRELAEELWVAYLGSLVAPGGLFKS